MARRKVIVRGPKLTTTKAQDTVLLQCAGIGIVTTLGYIRSGEGIKPKAMIGAGVLAVGLMGVAALDGELAVGIGTIALVSSTLAMIGGKNLGAMAFDQIGKIGDRFPTPGPGARVAFDAIGAAAQDVGDAAADAGGQAADAARGQVGATGGFAKPFATSYPAPGPHGSARNAFGGDAVDIMMPKGTPVYAVQGGRVDPNMFGPLSRDPGSVLGGQRLHIHTPDGNQWYYAHLDTIAVRPGAVVQAGQLLGTVGVANNVAHLHLEDKYQTVRRRV